MAIDSGGYLCTSSLRALITAWLDVSQTVEMLFGLSGSVRWSSVMGFDNPEDTALYKNLPSLCTFIHGPSAFAVHLCT